jgi:hypothetical protein
MKYSDAFPNSNRYLRGSDIEDGARIVAEISHVEMRETGRDRVEKPWLIFVDVGSALILNSTQWQTLETAFGEDSDTWAGHRIELTGWDGEARDGTKYRTIKIKPLDSPREEERTKAFEAAREREAAAAAARKAEAAAKEAAAVLAKRKAQAWPNDLKDDLNDEIPI